MAKKVFQNNEAIDKIKAGVNIVSNAVGSTMGACGRTVIISHHHLHPPNISRDGVSVANSIMLKDELENIGAFLIREAATKTMKIAGDGTSQTCVLAQSIINEGLKQISAGFNPQQVKKGIDKSVDAICEYLKEMSDPIGTNNAKIKNIATISSNNDIEIGSLIASAYEKIGNEGLLLIEESGTLKTVIEVVEGAEIPRGFISPEFATNKDKMTFNGEDAYVLVCDYTLSSVLKDLAPLFSQMEQTGIITKPLLIVAQDYEGEVFGTILKNVRQKTLNCCLSKAPSSYRQESMEDIAILTGATLISDREGLKMANVLIHHLGRAKSVIVSENTTTIAGGYGDPVKIAEHKNAVRVQMEDMKDEALKDVWKTRLGRISGSIGIIKVGGATDVEVKEKKDRVDDAKRAVESAIEEGVVVGGGVALLRCMEALLTVEYHEDEAIGRDIISKACKAPIINMLKNSGEEDLSIVKDVFRNQNTNYGYNMKTRKFEDLFESGVIDPTKVIRVAMQNAASVSCGILTSGYIVAELKSESI